jgi:hypothetical protein
MPRRPTAATEPEPTRKPARRAKPPKAAETIDRALALLEAVRSRVEDEDLEDAIALIRVARYRTGVEARHPKGRR